MYGFGDDQNPYTESVDFIEDLVIEYVTEMVSGSSTYRKNNKLALINAAYIDFCVLLILLNGLIL